MDAAFGLSAEDDDEEEEYENPPPSSHYQSTSTVLPASNYVDPATLHANVVCKQSNTTEKLITIFFLSSPLSDDQISPKIVYDKAVIIDKQSPFQPKTCELF